jgi:hypothetical protein
MTYAYCGRCVVTLLRNVVEPGSTVSLTKGKRYAPSNVGSSLADSVHINDVRVQLPVVSTADKSTDTVRVM